jgi:hypothetical protein
MTKRARDGASCDNEIVRTRIRLQRSMCERIKKQIPLQQNRVEAALLKLTERALETLQEHNRFKMYVADTLWRYEMADFRSSRQFELGELASSLLHFLSYSVGLEGSTDFAAAALIDLYVIDEQVDAAAAQYMKKSGENRFKIT